MWLVTIMKSGIPFNGKGIPDYPISDEADWSRRWRPEVRSRDLTEPSP